MPTLTDEQRVNLENKQLANALAKVNSGQVLNEREMALVEAAHARSKEATPQPVQPFFLPSEITPLGFEVLITETLESRGLYDLSRVRERKPELVKAAVKMLSLGVGVDEIADMLSLDVRTIAAIRDDAESTGAMPGHKEMTVRKLKSLLGLMLEKIEQKVKAGEFTITEAAIIIDKIELLSGGVTNRTETIITDDTEDFTRLVKQARARMVTEGKEVSPKAATWVPLPLPDSQEVSNIPAPSLSGDIQCTDATG